MVEEDGCKNLGAITVHKRILERVAVDGEDAYFFRRIVVGESPEFYAEFLGSTVSFEVCEEEGWESRSV